MRSDGYTTINFSRNHAGDWPHTRLLHTRAVGLGIAQLVDIDGLGLLNLRRRAVTNDNRLAAPFQDEVLRLGNVCEVDLWMDNTYG